MNFPWVIRIAPENTAALFSLRLLPGIEVAETTDALWLRGKPGDDNLNRELSLLPAEARYEELDDRRLRLVTRRIPSDSLPAVRWQSLGAWLKIESPPAAMPAFNVEPVPLSLVRSAEERNADVLLTTFSDWAAFVANAGCIRLDQLCFAAASDGKVLVRGDPLPPLPGKRFVVYSGLAVPAGFTWHPCVSAEVVVRLFNISPDALVLWHEDNTITRLHTEQFVAATWSAVRATMEVVTPSS